MRAYATREDMRLWRANVGAAMFKGRLVRFGVPGQADLTGMLNNGIRLEIEVKADDGVQSDEQIDYQNMIQKFGGVYILARSVDDVRKVLGR